MQNRERMSDHVVCIKITWRWCTQAGRQPGDWHNQVSSGALQAPGSCSGQFVLLSAVAQASSQMPPLFGLTGGLSRAAWCSQAMLWCSSSSLFKAVKGRHTRAADPAMLWDLPFSRFSLEGLLMMPCSCLEIPANAESSELRATAVIPFLNDWGTAGKLVNRLKSLFWSLLKRGWNVSFTS